VVMMLSQHFWCQFVHDVSVFAMIGLPFVRSFTEDECEF
jgi:hypothetical protein